MWCGRGADTAAQKIVMCWGEQECLWGVTPEKLRQEQRRFNSDSR